LLAAAGGLQLHAGRQCGGADHRRPRLWRDGACAEADPHQPCRRTWKLMPDITLSNVRKSYGGGRPPAGSGLDPPLGGGALLCPLGPSGCGKTTTLRMIAGLENLTGGEIRVGDRVIDSPAQGRFVGPEKRGMGLVFQSYALWPHLTIERNTDFGLRLRKVPKA